MASTVVISPDSLGQEKQKDSTSPSYWSPENHTSNNYLRVDKWLPDVEEFMFHGGSSTVTLSRDAGCALLRYREDIKMFAALEDQRRRGENNSDGFVESLNDPAFWDDHWDNALKEWPSYPTKSKWLETFLDLRDALDSAIVSTTDRCAFVKLSVLICFTLLSSALFVYCTFFIFPSFTPLLPCLSIATKI